MNQLFIIALTLTAFTIACDPYKKLAKSTNLKDRDSAAMRYFNDGQYEAAGLLFEELMGIHRGDSAMERYLYFYARCKFLSADYHTSAYYFDQYMQQYPAAQYTEDCAFMKAYSYYKQSNPYDLDQSESAKALDCFQLYLTIYPYAKRKTQANNLVTEIKDKLAHKSYYQADQFLKISHFRAATQAFKTMLQLYPTSRFKEPAMFKLVKSSYLLAHQSIEEKKEARYLEAIGNYQKYIDKFPSSSNKKEAESIYNSIQKELSKIKKIPVPNQVTP